MAGKLVAPSQKGARAAVVELPPYYPDTQEIGWDGDKGAPSEHKRVKAPDGTKYEVDGQIFILHHARQVAGGWKRMRNVTKKDKTTAKK